MVRAGGTEWQTLLNLKPKTLQARVVHHAFPRSWTRQEPQTRVISSLGFPEGKSLNLAQRHPFQALEPPTCKMMYVTSEFSYKMIHCLR